MYEILVAYALVMAFFGGVTYLLLSHPSWAFMFFVLSAALTFLIAYTWVEVLIGAVAYVIGLIAVCLLDER